MLNREKMFQLTVISGLGIAVTWEVMLLFSLKDTIKKMQNNLPSSHNYYKKLHSNGKFHIKIESY